MSDPPQMRREAGRSASPQLGTPFTLSEEAFVHDPLQRALAVLSAILHDVNAPHAMIDQILIRFQFRWAILPASPAREETALRLTLEDVLHDLVKHAIPEFVMHFNLRLATLTDEEMRDRWRHANDAHQREVIEAETTHILREMQERQT